MKYNSEVHHRRSIRLKGHDYSQAGLYFVTICIQDKLHLFGQIINGIMEINDAGIMVEKWWNELKNKFPNIKLDEYVVMPNHFHGILQIVDTNTVVNANIVDNTNTVGADLCVRPNNVGGHEMGGHKRGEHKRGEHKRGEHKRGEHKRGEHKRGEHKRGGHTGPPLHAMMQWFKTMTTNEYIRNVKNNHWAPFNKKLWQRDYYEHIIRNEKSYLRISGYIRKNPLKWQDDKYYE